MLAIMVAGLGASDRERSIPIIEPEAHHKVGLITTRRETQTPLVAALTSEAKRLAAKAARGRAGGVRWYRRDAVLARRPFGTLAARRPVTRWQQALRTPTICLSQPKPSSYPAQATCRLCSLGSKRSADPRRHIDFEA
jgi:hypothetical protein